MESASRSNLMTAPVLDRLSELNDIDKAVSSWRDELTWMRMAKPMITFYRNPSEGSGLEYYGRVAYQDTIRASFPFKKNVSAQGVLELRFDHYISEWMRAIPEDPHEKKNVIIRVDFFGGKLRWTGLLHHVAKKQRDGMYYMELTFNDDLQFLQFLLGPPNPALPIPAFQWPRVLPILGPAKWACSIMVLLNLIRKEGNLWQLPDDPFDLSQWLALSPTEWKNWQVHIKCNPLPLDDSSLWTVLGTRMNPIDSVLADALEDAQLTIRWRRVFTDEGETETGLLFVDRPANGALVFEIADDSGYYNTLLGGTFLGGTIVDGMVRSVVQYIGGFIEDTGQLLTDDESYSPDEYYSKGWLGTLAQQPWLVIRDSSWSPIDTAEMTWSPATAVSVVVGGDNPAADAIARLIIETTGNILGYFLLGGFSSAGTIAADVIMPFLQGTIAAWLEWKNTARARNLGWVHLWELYQQGAENNSWSLSALAALRGGFLASKSETSHTLSLHGNSWIIPGAHFQIGSRIGSTSRGYNDLIFVAQCEEIIPSWDHGNGSPLSVQVKIGQNKAAMSVGERLARLTKKIRDILQNIGVHLVS
ncbi:minor tail protein [Mycobacterium phage Auspice]|nr:minor tail protein [Mycobacterium phage Auspice]